MTATPAACLAACHAIDHADAMTPGELSQAAYEACIAPDVTPGIRGTLASLAALAYAENLAVPAAIAA